MNRANWAIAGTYFEACNCDVVCPCRAEGDRPGGASTYGHCDFVLSWWVRNGHHNALRLDDVTAVLVGTYVDDEELPAPRGMYVWNTSLYLDDRATSAQRAMLADILLGRAGGDTFNQYAAAIGPVHAVEPARIRLVHDETPPTIEVAGRARVMGSHPAPTAEPVTCGIPGQHQPGQEWVTATQEVHAGSFRWSLEGRCAFQSRFAYHSSAA